MTDGWYWHHYLAAVESREFRGLRWTPHLHKSASNLLLENLSTYCSRVDCPSTEIGEKELNKAHCLRSKGLQVEIRIFQKSSLDASSRIKNIDGAKKERMA